MFVSAGVEEKKSRSLLLFIMNKDDEVAVRSVPPAARERRVERASVDGKQGRRGRRSDGGGDERRWKGVRGVWG